MPRQRVFEALFTASGETLEDIVLPTDMELMDHTPVPNFPHLKSLSFLNRYAADIYPALDEEDPRFDSMRQNITAVSSSLHSLGTFGEDLWKCEVQQYSTLVELTLVVLTDIDSLGMIFTHSSQLRSLTLLVRDLGSSDLASIFRTCSNALPLFTAFRLSSHLDMEEDHAEAIAAFLEKKPLLERLDTGYYGNPPRFHEIQPLLEILQELPCLHVLGYTLLGFTRDYDSPGLTPNHLLRLSQYIPHGLTAPSLWVVVAPEAESPTVTETDWIQFV